MKSKLTCNNKVTKAFVCPALSLLHQPVVFSMFYEHIQNPISCQHGYTNSLKQKNSSRVFCKVYSRHLETNI